MKSNKLEIWEIAAMDNKNYQIPERIIKNIELKIIKELDKLGIFYRIFSRTKTFESIYRKLEVKKYNDQKKMQDLLGIRVVLYFEDDIEVCKEVISSIFEKVNESIDLHDSSTFEPTRTNIVFKLDNDTTNSLDIILHDNYIDNTFELQLRTVFSEGWHEIEHDLRYKCQSEWESYSGHSRTLNGILATLETCDWSIVSLFEDLAYKNYKDFNIEPMLRNKFRLRFNHEPIDENLQRIILTDKRLFKKIYRMEREEILKKLITLKFSIPLSFHNFIYICNYYFINNNEIDNITPNRLKKMIIPETALIDSK